MLEQQPSILAPESLTVKNFLSKISFDRLRGYLSENAFFFLWILVIPLVMLGMKQGRELLNGLFDDSGAYPGIRAASLLFAYFIQALAIWLLPRPLFKKAKEADFERLRTITTSNLHLGTIISVLPMMLYGGVMIWVQYRRNGSLWLVILALLIVAAGAWAAHWVIKKGHFRLRWLFCCCLVVCSATMCIGIIFS
jgi:hypothetical protein